MDKINATLRSLGISKDNLPSELSEKISAYSKRNDDFVDRYGKYNENPDNFTEDQIDALKELERELDIQEAEIVGEMKAWKKADKAEKQRLAEEEAARIKAQEESDAEAARIKAQEEADAEAARIKAQEESDAEAARIKAEQEAGEKKGSGLGGVLFGGLLLVITLGAINTFRK